jgi:ubiquinone biosynthesis protein UbiJ
MFPLPTAAALNHLLQQNRWALPRLACFAGRTARFDIAPFSFSFTVLPDGMLTGADTSTSADAVCVIPPSLLPRLALHDERAHADIRNEGDAAMLAEIFFLFGNLRWDAAEDLSRVTGDVAAERIVQAVQGGRQQLHDAALNLSQAAAEYLTEEHPLLVKPAQVAGFVQQVDTLRDDIARLEQRVARLKSSGNS